MRGKRIALPERDRVKLDALHAIDRPIDDISVAFICRSIGISRQTFYGYFKSKYDIAYWYLYQSEERLFDCTESAASWKDGLITQAELLLEEREHLRNAFASNPRDIDVIPRFEQSKERLANILVRGRELDTQRVRFCVSEYVNMHYRQIITWCIEGMKVEPKRFGMHCFDCIPNYLLDAAEGIASMH